MTVPVSIIIGLIILLIVLCFVASDPKIYIFTLLVSMLVVCGECKDPNLEKIGGGKSDRDEDTDKRGQNAKDLIFEPNEQIQSKIPKYNRPQAAQYDRLRGYAVTKKLDGLRVILYSEADKLWAVTDKGAASINKPSSLPNGSILDSEYYNDEFYVFDALFIDSIDIRNFNLDYRMNEVVKLECFKVKEHIYTGDLQADVRSLLGLNKGEKKDLKRDLQNSKKDNIDSKGDHIDGLIFTEINGRYDSIIYKAKPKELMTIDFVIGKGGALMVYLSRNPLVLKQFRQFSLSDFSGYKVGDVIECSWHGDRFKILRRRDDKGGVPNHEKTAISTMEQLQNPKYPSTYSDMVNKLEQYAVRGASEQIRKFHNTIKRRLVNIYCCQPNITVYDIGVGRGGDISKYKAVGVKRIIGIEPNKSGYIEELKRRAGNLGYGIVELDATNAATSMGLLWKNIGIEEFDHTWLNGIKETIVACSFFSLGFFFDKPDHIDILISRLGKAKYFIGCTIDGQQMKKIGKVKNDIFETTPINATTLKFHMNGDTTVQDQDEYYVDWPLFTEKMKDAGFEVIEDNLFNPPSYFTKDQTLFSSLYRRFVFMRSDK